MKRMIGIVGGSIYGNKGAEAMTTTVIGLLQRHLPEAEFLLFSPYYKADKPLQGRYRRTTVVDGTPASLVMKTFAPIVLERLVRWGGLKPSCLFEPSRLVSQCDLVLDLAGISFCDGRDIYLPFNVLTILPALLLGVRVAKLSQAMGPFAHRVNRLCARWLLPQCSYLAARGAHTAENLRTIGIEAPECPDVAFALNDLADMERLEPELSALLEFGDDRPMVGISPSSVVFKNCRRLGIDYLGIITDFVRHVISRGYRVMLMPHSIRTDTDKLKNNDLPVVRKIGHSVGESRYLMMVLADLDSIALRKLIGQCQLFLASRFHSMVSALAMGVPVTVCGWGHKYYEVLDMLGQCDYALDYRGLTFKEQVEAFEHLEADSAICRNRIRAALPDVMERARRQVDGVVAMLNDWPKRCSL
ncbi:MAG: polysaccharide pyruvyl transferase family protein [Planctomycetes bacterium]|nr:polysaccharide pyruvyl transferase family protein [Planctomycetota bacterium]